MTFELTLAKKDIHQNRIHERGSTRTKSVPKGVAAHRRVAPGSPDVARTALKSAPEAISPDLIRQSDNPDSAAERQLRRERPDRRLRDRTITERQRWLHLIPLDWTRLAALIGVSNAVMMVLARGLAGFEALLRWNHPTKRLISPEKFVTIAEDSGLISAIGE